MRHFLTCLLLLASPLLAVDELYVIQGANWTPANLNTVAWYDPSNPANVTTNATGVTQIDDLSGNGYHGLQSVAANQPNYGTNEINGLPCLFIDDGSEWLVATNMSYESTSLSVFWVGDFEVRSFNAGNATIFEVNTTPNNVRFRSRNFPWDGRVQSTADGSANMTLSGNYLTPHIGEVYLDASSGLYRMFRNAGESSVTLAYSTLIGASGDFDIAGDSINNAVAGDVGEMIVVADVSELERDRIEGYLAHKWGVEADLPAGHPYKAAPPTVNALLMVGGKPAVIPPWNPLQAGDDLVAWYDATDTATLTTNVSGSVSQWDDKSGNGYDISNGNGGQQPQFSPGIMNGKDALWYSSTFDKLSLTGIPDINVTEITLVSIGMAGTSGDWPNFGHVYSTDGSDRVVQRIQKGSGSAKDRSVIELDNVSTGFNAAQDTNAANLVPFVITTWYDGDRGQGHFNGGSGSVTDVNVADGATITINEIRVGRDSNTPRNYHGEFIVLSSADTNLIAKAEGYLAWKWGTQSKLPVSHPYKNERP